jgi:hypothetical protein
MTGPAHYHAMHTFVTKKYYFLLSIVDCNLKTPLEIANESQSGVSFF